MATVTSAEDEREAPHTRRAGVRPEFLLGLTVILAAGALGVSLLGYLETRARLDRLEYGVDTTVSLRRPAHYRLEAAQEDAARFANANLLSIETFPSKLALLGHAVSLVEADTPGLFAEFGVYRGTTINHIAKQTDRTVHGFDSFEGLPENWREGFEEGHFKMDQLPEVRDNVVLHKGWFDETLPGFRRTYPEPVAFLHLDADLYSSTKTVLEGLADRIQPGTVLVFDEMIGYPGWQQGEFQAFLEFVETHDVGFTYVGWVPTGEQVALRIDEIGEATRLTAAAPDA